MKIRMIQIPQEQNILSKCFEEEETMEVVLPDGALAHFCQGQTQVYLYSFQGRWDAPEVQLPEIAMKWASEILLRMDTNGENDSLGWIELWGRRLEPLFGKHVDISFCIGTQEDLEDEEIACTMVLRT